MKCEECGTLKPDMIYYHHKGVPYYFCSNECATDYLNRKKYRAERYWPGKICWKCERCDQLWLAPSAPTMDCPDCGGWCSGVKIFYISGIGRPESHLYESPKDSTKQTRLEVKP